MGRTVYRRMDILKQIADAVTGIGEKVLKQIVRLLNKRR